MVPFFSEKTLAYALGYGVGGFGLGMMVKSATEKFSMRIDESDLYQGPQKVIKCAVSLIGIITVTAAAHYAYPAVVVKFLTNAALRGGVMGAHTTAIQALCSLLDAPFETEDVYKCRANCASEVNPSSLASPSKSQ